MAPLRLLVTGAGAPGIRGTLHALRHNPDGRMVHVVGIDLDTHAVGRYLADAFHTVPAPESPTYLSAVAMVCEREGVDLVLPQTTREIAVLAAHRDTLRGEGIVVAVSSAEAVRRANDKGEVLRTFEALGLPVPAWRRASTEHALVEAAEALGYPDQPVVVKPPVSNGMRGLRILREAAWDAERYLSDKPSGIEVGLDDLLAILRRGDTWPELLATAYLPGPEYSVDAFRGAQVAVALPRRRDAIRSGISFRTTLLPDRHDLAEPTLRAAEALGLEYAFGFQFKEDADGVPRVLECNPRVQGTMAASVFGGFNPIWMAVQEALGAPPQQVPARRTAVLQRYWGGLGIDGTTVTDL